MEQIDIRLHLFNEQAIEMMIDTIEVISLDAGENPSYDDKVRIYENIKLFDKEKINTVYNRFFELIVINLN